MADDAAGGANGVDQAGATVQHRFKEFLTDFRPRSLNSTHGDGGFDVSMMVETTDAELTSMQRATYDYVAQLAHMAQNNKTTLFVNFQHVVEKDAELAEAIEMEYYRFEPFLRQSIEALITEMKNQDGTAAAFSEGYGAKQEYAVSFYAMSRVERIRAMKTDKIGRLMSISGTVTRSSDVRPELMYASFQCEKCGRVHDRVEQQYQLTYPPRCLNDKCGCHNFNLVVPSSTFVDWQRLRVQENADEIPAGSMPRSVEVICRNELVELAKAGDKVIFTGFVAVIPDNGGLARAGESTTKGPERGGFNDGVAGMKGMGVKEMTYKLMFVACGIIQADKLTATEYGDTKNAAATVSGVEGADPSATATAALRLKERDEAMALIKELEDQAEEVKGAMVEGEGDAGIMEAEQQDLAERLKYAKAALSLRNQVPSLTELNGQGANQSMDAHNDGEREAVELTELDRTILRDMRTTPHLYHRMTESICPSVFGHLEVKRGIMLMLLGGVHKRTKEKISLRGDINVCIVGDPSCAKSQFLKYVHNFMPRSVYTSGKSSSAAGLTASVVRDPDTGEFCVEAGALMLADNGICCIDEFDKMDPKDQVAIHEAMEQQTISITKSGVQATLNARTSILAAANPVFGRYDRSKPLKANVNISAPIMSRFDLFFVIVDECQASIDASIARHIIDNHRAGGRAVIKQAAPFTTEQLQRYIRFARTINPVLTPEARTVLVTSYRLLRQNDMLGKNKTSYRITVRQLESLVRLSEALARLHLDHYVQAVHVKEAYRLLQKSIIFVETEDVELEDIEEQLEARAADRRTMEHLNGDDDDSDEDGDNGGGEMDQQHGADDDGVAGSRGGNGDSRGYEESKDGGASSPVRSPGSVHGKRGKEQQQDGDGAGGEPDSAEKRRKVSETQEVATTAATELPASAALAVAVGKKKKTNNMSASEYANLTTLVKLYLSKRERDGAMDGGEGEGEGDGEEKQERGREQDGLDDDDASSHAVEGAVRELYQPLIAASPIHITGASRSRQGTTTIHLYDDGVVLTGEEDSFYGSGDDRVVAPGGKDNTDAQEEGGGITLLGLMKALAAGETPSSWKAAGAAAAPETETEGTAPQEEPTEAEVVIIDRTGSRFKPAPALPAVAGDLGDKEEGSRSSSSGKGFSGISWNDLVQWLLSQESEQANIASVEELEQRKKRLSLVVRRMVKNEGTLIVVGNHDEANEDKVLKLQPSEWV